MSDKPHKTISVGRKNVAFGLEWFALEADDAPRKAAASLAKRSAEHFDIVVARKGEYPQFAIGSTTSGAKPSAISAAAIAAEMMSTDSWLYVMEIGTDIWVGCGREGYVLPDGDRVFENAFDAKEAVRRLNPSSFKKVFMPASWREDGDGIFGRGGSSDVALTDFHDFLTYDMPKWGRLTKLTGNNVAVQAIIGVLLLGGIGFAAFQFLQSPSGPSPDDVRRQLEAMRKQQEVERQALYDELSSDRPWAAHPRADDMLATCVAEIQKMPIRPVGYEVTSIVCGNGTIDAEVGRTTGYTSWLLEWAQNYPGLSASTDATGSSGYISAEFSPRARRADRDLSENYEAISADVLATAQIEGAGVTLGQPTARTLEDYPDYTPIYASAPFEITTTRPSIWVEALKSHDGIVLDTVTFSISDKVYTMEGTLYVPNLQSF